MDYNMMIDIKYIDPFLNEDDVAEAYMVNDFDLFVRLKDGRKYIVDTLTHGFRGFYPEGHEITDEEWATGFKYRLRTLLNRRHMTQEELADRLGVTRRTINRYINGESLPNCVLLRKMSIVLNYPLDEFFYKEY